MLLLQVEQWKKKEWVSEPPPDLEEAQHWGWCFPKHWNSNDNSSTTWCSLALAIRVPFCWHSRKFTSLRRWFRGSSTFLLCSGTFLPYFATFLLYSGSESGCTRIFQNLKRTTIVLLFLRKIQQIQRILESRESICLDVWVQTPSQHIGWWISNQ